MTAVNFQEFYNKTLKIFMGALFFILLSVSLPEAAPIRIVVLPGYAESGKDVISEQEIMTHYRRAMRFINNELVRHGFEVVNPVAKELQENYYAELNQRTTATTKNACAILNQKYETDVAYIIWLDVRSQRTRDRRMCKVTARIDGEGYDSGGNDLGAGLSKVFTTVRRNCVEAVELAEKEVGYSVGRILTAYQPK